MSEERVFKCVPINHQWTQPGTKHDVKAMYRRPNFTVGEYDELVPSRGPDGRPLYDLIGPLPMRRHADWQALGYEYVTVVCSPPHMQNSQWPLIAAWLRANNVQQPQEFLQHPELGTWNPKLYLKTADQVDVNRFAALREAVFRFGSEAVTNIRQQTDPKFELPEDLQGIKPGTPDPLLATEAAPSKPAAGAGAGSTRATTAAERKAAAAAKTTETGAEAKG